MKKLLSSAVLAATLMASPFFAQAADNPADAPKTEKKATPVRFAGKIGSVDKAAKTITLENKEKTRVFLITSDTRIRKDRKPATLDDVQVGERVGGSARENTAGKMEVVTLNVGIPVRGPKAKEGDNNPAKQ
jgi:hypothetical protein